MELSNGSDRLNPVHARSGWPPVVVAGASQTGVCLMRDFSRRGVSASCFDCMPAFVGFKSFYGKAHLCPNPDNHPAEWLDFMIRLARKTGGRPVLISSADQFITAIAQHAAALQEYFIFPAASIATQDLLATKKRQYDIADSNGLGVPRTRFVRSWAELREFAEGARFPCLLKPVHFREWTRFPTTHPLYDQKVAVARDLGELEAKYRLAEEVTSELVVQEIVEGPDSAKLVYLSCYSQRGERLAACVLRQLRTYPIYFGSASIVAPVDDPETDRLCDNFLRRIGYRGICEIELKRDSRTNEVKMIEANPRYSVTADAAPYLGLHIGWLHYLDLIGEPVAPVVAAKTDLHHIVLQRDFACYRSYLEAGLWTWKSLLASYRPPVAFYDFDPLDWRVTYLTCVNLFKILGLPLYRRWFKRNAA